MSDTSSHTDPKPRIQRSFGLTNLSLKNRTTVLFLTFMVILFGIDAYVELPKDSYPEIKINQIYIGTPYPGNSPLDIENLITRPIEKSLNTISEVEEITSSTLQDYSTIIVEFPPDMETQEALTKVKDAVDKAKSELPTDLDQDPSVIEFDFANFPILNINLSGDYEIAALEGFAEQLEDAIERVPEVAKVEIRGVDEQELQILLDIHKMDAAKVSFSDIENAIASENVNVSSGDILEGGLRRSIRVLGQFETPEELRGVIVRSEKGNIVHLADIADIQFGYRKEKKSYARLNGQPVVSLDVVKRSGQNLLLATDKLFRIIEKYKKQFPPDLSITITNDQSTSTRQMVSNLENNIIAGVILVVLVLQFFLGTRSALFVGIAIPLSMLLSFGVLAALGATVNMMVLFSLIMALGMLVDNGIVVVENIYRLLEKGLSLWDATRQGVGEVALPIISSTLTTLGAFFPLILWPGIVGEFMKYLPITLIITLSASLFVALVINPVFISLFMKTSPKSNGSRSRRIWRNALILLAIGLLLVLIQWRVLGNLLLIAGILTLIGFYVVAPATRLFQQKTIPYIERKYTRLLQYALHNKAPYAFLGGTIFLFIISFVLLGLFTPKVIFFPINQPQYVNVFVEFPVGTQIEQTNRFTKQLEAQIMDHMRPYSYMVESIISKVGAGASDPEETDSSQSESPNKASITVNFKDFEYRKGVLTTDLMEEIRQLVGDQPGVLIRVAKNRSGPPVGKAISIELVGEDLATLSLLAEQIKEFIDRAGIRGIEGLKLDLERNKPEVLVRIDRDKARRYGLSTFQVANEIRTSLFGKEISKYKLGEDDFEINVRLDEPYRHDLQKLMSKRVVFQDKSSGQKVKVPISSVAQTRYGNTYTRVNRKDLQRVLTLSSNVTGGYNPTEVNQELRSLLDDFQLPPGYDLRFGGEQEKQQEEFAFLSRAFLIAVFIIFLIIITQFNRISSPVLIITTVGFSSIGVLLGLVVFQMDFVIIMTMIGLISLAGIVVNNAIVLLDFVEASQRQRRLELGTDRLSFSELTACIVSAGKARIRPVLLTAITTILGLIPMATGINIDFIGFLNNYDANFYIGGDNAIFWGPMSWTIIFGLSFATFLTLVILPVMYWLAARLYYALRRLPLA